MGTIFTIGYEGSTPDLFVKTLQQHDVEILLDIREFAISRKKGFSKNQLKDLLMSGGIGYRHERQLGSPKDVRKRLYESKDYKVFFEEYDEYLKSQEALLATLGTEIDCNVALMCFEKDVLTCHRKSVARELSLLTGSSVRHLSVK